MYYKRSGSMTWLFALQCPLQRVILAGHSLAGEELTRLAAEHRERVVGLIYIDAAYDLTKAPLAQCATAITPEERRQR